MDISIIIPFYNGNKYLNQIVQMFSANIENLGKGLSVELVIVNDSPWVTVERVEMQNEYPVKILNFENNVGIQGARIRGIQASEGKYILMLDQDDIISERFLLEMYSAIQDADVCVANGELVRPTGSKPIYLNEKKQKLVGNLLSYVYLENRILSPGHCLIKKSSIPKEWMDNPLKKNGADDLLLWILMLCKKCKFVYVTNKLYSHIDTGENVSSDEMNMAESTYEVCYVLEKSGYVAKWIITLLRRKIENDVCYIQTGRDKYFDYRMIERLRRILHRSRN